MSAKVWREARNMSREGCLYQLIRANAHHVKAGRAEYLGVILGKSLFLYITAVQCAWKTFMLENSVPACLNKSDTSWQNQRWWNRDAACLSSEEASKPARDPVINIELKWRLSVCVYCANVYNHFICGCDYKHKWSHSLILNVYLKPYLFRLCVCAEVFCVGE